VFTIDAAVIDALRRRRDEQIDLSDRAASPLVDDPFILSDNANGGRPIPPSLITRRFGVLRREAGVPRVRFHDLRHANASELLGRGVDGSTVAARLGHSSTRMTLDRYAHALPAGDVRAASIIGGLLPAADQARR
jgi:integrase